MPLLLHFLIFKHQFLSGQCSIISHYAIKNHLKNLCLCLSLMICVTHEIDSVLPQLTYMRTVRNVCTLCVKNGSHFIFSWWHIPPWIPFHLCHVSSAMIWQYLVQSVWWDVIISIGYPLPQVPVFLHHVVFLLGFSAPLAGNHLVSENVFHLCWPSRSN